MARQTKPLTDTEIKKAKPKEKEYYLSDGQGLQLRIRPNGSKSWLFNYTSPTKQKRTNLGLGMYPALSLKNARDQAMKARELVVQNIDPKDHREQLKAKQEAEQKNTFLTIATEWMEVKRSEVTEKTAKDMWRSLELHILPMIASTPIHLITAPMVKDMLKPIEAKGNLETVKRLCQRLSEIMGYAANCGYITASPLSHIGDVFKKPVKKNMPALPPEQLPDLLQSIANANLKLSTRLAILLQLHTMTRPQETARAKWSEIDFENEVWNVEADRMKGRQQHKIPLSKQVIQMLEVMQQISGNRPYVFPANSKPNSHMNTQTANQALKRMGYQGKQVAHGLRAIASTTLNEQGKDHRVIEAALAHKEKNQTVAAYNRATYFEARIVLMQEWSDHITSCSVQVSSITL